MADQPIASQSLIELLDRLQLATAGQVQSVAPLVARLARDLPHFDSVWVDALAQARVLTPLQAARINSARGEELQTGPYLIRSELPGPGYARCYAAIRLPTRQPMRLLVVDRTEAPPGTVARELARLVEASRLVTHSGLAPINDAGIDGGRIWAASRPVNGTPAARWMVENGRLPGNVVLHIARQIAAAMMELHGLEVVHGDLSALSLSVAENGRIFLSHPGLRGIVRPAEGYAYSDLPPEAYDTLAPERIALAAPPSIATDIYACGCLLWHLATGRPPFAGGNTIAKLRAVHSAKTTDIVQLAPDVPPQLAQVIRICMAPDSAHRPVSMQELNALLGPVPRGANSAVQRLLRQPQGPRHLWGPSIPGRKSLAARLAHATAVAACLAVLLGASVGWRYRHQLAWWPHREAKAVAAVVARVDSRPTVATVGRFGSDTVDPGRDVLPVNHLVPIHTPPAPAIEPRLLPSDRPQRIARLDLQPGQTVRGAHGGRPLIYVPAQGLVVQGENLLFENLDFAWDVATATPDDPGKVSAILRLSAEHVEFRGCSFQDARSPADRLATDWRPTAIEWSGAVQAAGRRDASLGGDLILDSCVFSGIDAAVECRPERVPSIEFSQSLHLRGGPLVRLGAVPRSDQTFMLSLLNTTVRAAEAVLECRVDSASSQRQLPPGQINISAVECVLALDSTAALVLFTGAEPPDALLSQMDWTGQGSLVTPKALMAAWRINTDELPRTIAEERVQVAGLVRSQVEFAGDASAGPIAANIRRWQAPLRSNQAPGAGPGRLGLPSVGPMGR